MKLNQIATAVFATALMAAPAFAAEAPAHGDVHGHGHAHGHGHGANHGKDHGKGHDSLHEALKQVCDIAKHTRADAVVSKCSELMEGHTKAVLAHKEMADMHGHGHGHGHGHAHGAEAAPAMPSHP